MKQLEKEEKIRDLKERLSLKYKDITSDKIELAEELISKAAFMSVSLDELQDIINRKGYLEKYQNGSTQKGVKKSSEVDTYNTMLKNFNTTMKILESMLPKTILKGEVDQRLISELKDKALFSFIHGEKEEYKKLCNTLETITCKSIEEIL